MRLGDCKEGAQEVFSLSHSHFCVQPWIYQGRFSESKAVQKVQICSPVWAYSTQPSSTPSALTSQYSQDLQWALFHLQGRLLSQIYTFTHTEKHTYTHTEHILEGQAVAAPKVVFLILKWKKQNKITYIFKTLSSSICPCLNKHRASSSHSYQTEDGIRWEMTFV